MSFFNGMISDCSHNKYMFIVNEKNSITAHSQYTKTAYTAPLHTKSQRKRMSLCLLNRDLSAGISIEAALSVSFFIFFMSNLMMLIIIFKTYSLNLSKVQQLARYQALITSDDAGGSDMVSYQISVPVKSFTNAIGFPTGYTNAKIQYRKWTGYDPGMDTTAEAEQDEYVYVAEYGTVYHRNRECSHLNITMQIIAAEDIDKCRNNSMEKYYPCEKCGGNGTGILFITPDGNRYHSSAKCSGLKRKIKTVKLSEVQGMEACSLCGG